MNPKRKSQTKQDLQEAIRDFGRSAGLVGAIGGAVLWFVWATATAILGGIWPNNRFNGENLRHPGWLEQHTAVAAPMSAIACFSVAAVIYVIFSEEREKISLLRKEAGYGNTATGIMGGIQGAALGAGCVVIFIFYSIITIVSFVIVPIILAIIAMLIIML